LPDDETGLVTRLLLIELDGPPDPDGRRETDLFSVDGGGLVNASLRAVDVVDEDSADEPAVRMGVALAEDDGGPIDPGTRRADIEAERGVELFLACLVVDPTPEEVLFMGGVTLSVVEAAVETASDTSDMALGGRELRLTGGIDD
jgi:hypothetical protein